MRAAGGPCCANLDADKELQRHGCRVQINIDRCLIMHQLALVPSVVLTPCRYELMHDMVSLSCLSEPG